MTSIFCIAVVVMTSPSKPFIFSSVWLRVSSDLNIIDSWILPVSRRCRWNIVLPITLSLSTSQPNVSRGFPVCYFSTEICVSVIASCTTYCIVIFSFSCSLTSTSLATVTVCLTTWCKLLPCTLSVCPTGKSFFTSVPLFRRFFLIRYFLNELTNILMWPTVGFLAILLVNGVC